MNIQEALKDKWDLSYLNGDNNILYPQTEVIRFLNKFISKRNNDRTINKLIGSSASGPIRGLDFACGVGTHCITFAEFGIEGYGVDISSVAIDMARKNALAKGVAPNNFYVLNPNDETLPFEDNFFDFIVAESCLDSMPNIVAKRYVGEFKRVCKGPIYASFIGEDDVINGGEFIVETAHEKGTVQSVYDLEKICDLFGANKQLFSYFSTLDTFDQISIRLIGKRHHCVINGDFIHRQHM